MEKYKLQLIETLLIVVSFLLIKFILKYFVKITIVNSYFKNSVRKEVIKLINLILFISFCVITISIWSVKQENVLLFASTLLTVFGVALFSEKSILSNITSYIILFFQHLTTIITQMKNVLMCLKREIKIPKIHLMMKKI